MDIEFTQNMEIEKLNDFLKNCCRVCLSVENEMVESTNIVENFNKTIDQLLFEYTSLKMESETDSYPQKLCEICTTELVMIAKFREKWEMSTNVLNQIKRQISKIQTEVQNNESLQIEPADLAINSKDKSKSDTFYENIEYVEDNGIEYVIYDTNADFIDEVVEDSVQRDDNSSMEDDDDDEEYNCNIEPTKKRVSQTKKRKRSNDEIESKLTIKSAIKHHCKRCGAGFAQLNNFTRHLQTHNEHDNEQEFVIVKDDGDIEYSIDEIANVTSETTQQDVFNNATISIDHQTTSKKNIQKNHGCKYCDRAFPSLSLLATHTRIHTGERPFQCTMANCLKAFKTQGALDLHVRRHSGVKPYKCSICNRGFVESSNLKVHMRTHTGEKPHQCVTCGRSFSRVFLLQIHSRTHTGEKPFGCEICSKSFAQQGDLAAHKRIHSGERPHRCSVCFKGFIKSSGLTQHMRRHLRSNSKANNAAEPINEKVMICYKEFNETSETFDGPILQ